MLGFNNQLTNEYFWKYPESFQGNRLFVERTVWGTPESDCQILSVGAKSGGSGESLTPGH